MAQIKARIWNSSAMVQVKEDKDREKKDFKKIENMNPRSQLPTILALMLLVDEINQDPDKKYSNAVLTLCEQNEEFYKGLIDPNL